jgi:hypothetical protein
MLVLSLFGQLRRDVPHKDLRFRQTKGKLNHWCSFSVMSRTITVQ